MTKTKAIALIKDRRKHGVQWEDIAAELAKAGYVGERSGNALSVSGLKYMVVKRKKPRTESRSTRPSMIEDIRAIIRIKNLSAQKKLETIAQMVR